MASARVLPCSTPYWSKLLMPHSAPWTTVWCSYSATSWPSTDGDSSGAMITVDGRLPGSSR